MGPCPICGTGWGGQHRTLSVFLYGGQCRCVCCNVWCCSRSHWVAFNSTTWRALLHFLSAYVHSLSLVDFKLLVFPKISQLNLVPSYVSGPNPAVGLLVHMSWTRPHTTQHCQVWCEVDMQQ